MDQKKQTPEPQPSEEHKPAPGYTPASPAKRAMAWTGVAYMLILVALNTYLIFTGTPLTGLAPLLTVPGLVGLSVVIQLWMKERGRTTVLFLLHAVCIALAAFFLVIGLPGLLANFGG